MLLRLGSFLARELFFGELLFWGAFGGELLGGELFFGELMSIHQFILHRNSLGLLIGSFYLPTGLFGFLSIGSYIFNPDMVNS